MEEENNGNILKAEMILQKAKAMSLAEVRSLNIWGYNLTNISIISKCPNINTISMPINSIKTLSPFQHCTNLKNLLLRQNLISSFSELKYLQNLTYLENLTLSDNPISFLPNYRSTVISMLPQLKKLDNLDIFLNDNERPFISPHKSVDYINDQRFYNQQKSFIDENDSSIHNNLANKSLNMKIFVQSHSKQKQKEQFQRQMQQIREKSKAFATNSSEDDSHYLTAVLSLIPELSIDSLQIVLDAIHQRCLQ